MSLGQDTGLKKMNELALAYMKQVLETRKEKILQAVEDAADQEDPRIFDLTVGQAIQLAYCQGYHDCKENKEVRTLIF